MGPSSPGDQLAPGAPGALPAPGMPIRPGPIPYPRLIPAGAVLVAVQGTNLSARTDDQGRFRIDNMPVGQYVTIAAGPVQNVTAAVSIRPNVFIQNGGQTVDLGRLYLGQTYGYYGPVPYGAAPGAVGSGAATPDTNQAQP
ncbi:MAG: carboxypeptidase-like regulatory domain-containing protein [Actinobacteria bacterium]|nr:carboxypeptidase-like regulatory domain-containing protein [Actinomycetota bacterium]